MLVRTIAAADNTAVQTPRKYVRRSRRPMSDDHQVDIECFDCFGRVDERFAFGNAASGRREFDRVRTQSFRGERKTIARACGVFEKQIGHCPASQQRKLVPTVFRVPTEVFSGIQNGHNFFPRQAF